MKSAAKFLENLKQGMNIGLVFGESREIGRKTIIPVAHFSYGMGQGEGGGSKGRKSCCDDKQNIELQDENEVVADGSTEESSNKDKGGFGEGFGGGFKAKPVGIFQITENKTLFIPVVSAKQIIFIALTIFWMFKRKKKRRR